MTGWRTEFEVGQNAFRIATIDCQNKNDHTKWLGYSRMESLTEKHIFIV